MGWHLDKVNQNTKASASLREEEKSSYSRPLHLEAQHDSCRESISRKYTAIRRHETKQERDLTLKGNIHSTPLHDAGNSQTSKVEPSSGLSSTWQSVKMGFRQFKSNIEAKKFIPLRQVQDAKHIRDSSSESLDEIFERIKRPTLDHRNRGSDDDDDDDGDLDDYGMRITRHGPSI